MDNDDMESLVYKSDIPACVEHDKLSDSGRDELVIIDVSMKDDSTMPQQKRGRGRPRKNKSDISNEQVSQIGQDECSEHTINNNEMFSSQATDIAMNGVSDLPTITKRGKGRPRKIKPIVIKRGRGRPSKSKNMEEVTRIKLPRGRPRKIRDLNEIFLPKRGKGRPLGSKNKPKPNAEDRYDISRKKSKAAKENKPIVPTRYIPKEHFEESLRMLKDSDHPVWKDNKYTSCILPIHRCYEEEVLCFSERHLRIKYARQCTLRRDWVNLTKVLCLAARDRKARTVSHYPLLAKYGAVCLAHTDRQQFNKFVNHMTNMEDASSVLKQCTQFNEKLFESVV